MSNIFKLPMVCEDGEDCIHSADFRYSIKFDDTDTNCFEQKRFVADAINQHVKLTEQNKMLRESLSVLCSNFSQWGNLSPMDEAIINSALKVLAVVEC